jgi:hypothetical protein
MKALIFSVLFAFQIIPTAVASNHTVEKYLPNIRDRVRQCSILPFAFDANQVRKEKALQSHCPEVKLIPVAGAHAMAKIRVAGHQFVAQLVETDYSDGDVFDVEIRNLNTLETYRIYNVLAFGDVLLGVLGGETKGVSTLHVRE